MSKSQSLWGAPSSAPLDLLKNSAHESLAPELDFEQEVLVLHRSHWTNTMVVQNAGGVVALDKDLAQELQVKDSGEITP